MTEGWIAGSVGKFFPNKQEEQTVNSYDTYKCWVRVAAYLQSQVGKSEKGSTEQAG